LKALVLFDSLFGNTQKIANCIAEGLREAGVETDCVSIKEARMGEVYKYDLLAVGAPTQMFTASKPMKEFLDRLKTVDLHGKAGFAFDTKLESRFSGSAAKFIEKKLGDLGLDIIKVRASAIVVGRKEKGSKAGDAVLKEGMEALFREAGRDLGRFLQARRQKVGIA